MSANRQRTDKNREEGEQNDIIMDTNYSECRPARSVYEMGS